MIKPTVSCTIRQFIRGRNAIPRKFSRQFYVNTRDDDFNFNHFAFSTAERWLQNFPIDNLSPSSLSKRYFLSPLSFLSLFPSFSLSFLFISTINRLISRKITQGRIITRGKGSRRRTASSARACKTRRDISAWGWGRQKSSVADGRAENHDDFSRARLKARPHPRGERDARQGLAGAGLMESARVESVPGVVAPRHVGMAEGARRAMVRTIITSRWRRQGTITVKARREHGQKAKISVRRAGEEIVFQLLAAVARYALLYCCPARWTSVDAVFFFFFLLGARLEEPRGPRKGRTLGKLESSGLTGRWASRVQTI